MALHTQDLKQKPADLGAQSFKNEKAGFIVQEISQNSSIYYDVVRWAERQDSDQNGRLQNSEDHSPGGALRSFLASPCPQVLNIYSLCKK